MDSETVFTKADLLTALNESPADTSVEVVLRGKDGYRPLVSVTTVRLERIDGDEARTLIVLG